MEAEGFVDRPGLLARACTALSEGRGLPPLLVLDLPLSSFAEERLLEGILRGSSEVFASLPPDDARSGRVLEAALGEKVVVSSPELESGLGRLQGGLFSEEDLTAGAVDDSVVLFSAPGEARECVEIVRRVQRAAGRGVPYDRMAILLRRQRSHAPSIVNPAPVRIPIRSPYLSKTLTEG